jgi:hypothetical protein
MSETFTLLLRRLSSLISYLHPDTLRSQRARARREQWDGQAVWFRLRYDDAHKATVMVQRLGSAVGKRVGLRLRYVDGTTLQCFIAVESKYAQVAEEMAASFGCRLVRSHPPTPLPGLFYRRTLPSDFTAVDAYVTGGTMFVLPVYSRATVTLAEPVSSEVGDFFPGETSSHVSRGREAALKSELAAGVQPGEWSSQSCRSNQNLWSLPVPVLGTSARISLSLATPAALLRREHEWLVGWDSRGRSVGAYQAGLMGESGAVRGWLTGLLLSVMRNNEKNVVLLDGQGTLVDALLSRPYVTRLVQAGLVHVLDVRRSLQTAFNPLTLPQAGTMEKQAAGAAVRWQWWFEGMGSPVTAALLEDAARAGVRTIPDFYRWVLAIRKGQPEIGTSLMTAVKRLDRDEEVREWLMAQERFVDPRLLAKHGIVLVTARLSDGTGSQWARQQALRGLLGLLVESRSSLILHDVKLERRDRKLLRQMRFLVSHTPASTTIVTRSHDELACRLANRFVVNGSHAILPEHLQLLPPGSAIVSGRDGNTALVSWKSGL